MKGLLGSVLVLALLASTAMAGDCANGTCCPVERGPVAKVLHKVLPPYHCGKTCVPACEPAPCEPACTPAPACEPCEPCCEVKKVRCWKPLAKLRCRIAARRCCCQ